MLATALSYGLSGVSGYAVHVEVYAANGLPALEIIGLPDASVKESRDRVSAAIANSGFAMPIARLTVNLAPADTRKEGPSFDLPIAVCILAATRQLPAEHLEEVLLLGELSLDGSLKPVRGALPMVISASENGVKEVILPEATPRKWPASRASASTRPEISPRWSITCAGPRASPSRSSGHTAISSAAPSR